MLWGGKEITEEDFEQLLSGLLISSEAALIIAAYWLHHECHLWDEIDPKDMELVVRQNMGKWLLKRASMVREANIYELTRRLFEAPEPAPLRGKEK